MVNNKSANVIVVNSILPTRDSNSQSSWITFYCDLQLSGRTRRTWGAGHVATDYKRVERMTVSCLLLHLSISNPTKWHLIDLHSPHPLLRLLYPNQLFLSLLTQCVLICTPENETHLVNGIIKQQSHWRIRVTRWCLGSASQFILLPYLDGWNYNVDITISTFIHPNSIKIHQHTDTSTCDLAWVLNTIFIRDSIFCVYSIE